MEIKLEFISADVLSGMTIQQKMDFILEHVKDDKIIVIEEGMTPFEETTLIQATMTQVTKKFPGVEVSTLREKSTQGLRERLIRMLGGSRGGLTVIGPSRIVRQISKDPRRISMLAGEEDDKKKPKQ